ncbi:phospholipid-translocating ATPase [Flagelloscypha sp. PMI_526]|nr:phospholipid-translocating ATPase [Flagelloscypha sp. PMI_526]
MEKTKGILRTLSKLECRPGPPRTVYTEFKEKGKVKKDHIYRSNQVLTSKYSVISFLPRNLLEQFRRIANVFVIAILQFFPQFSTVTPGLVILPLLVVLGVTALKDGYEDIKRHQSDRQVNETLTLSLVGDEHFINENAVESISHSIFGRVWNLGVRIFKGRLSAEDPPPRRHQRMPSFSTEKAYWQHIRWEDLKVGSFVKLKRNEPIPADILICSTSAEEDVCFVETKNLDGETNLKSRSACPELTIFRNAKDCCDKSWWIDCERPDVDMYRLNATVTIPQDNGQKPLQAPVSLVNVLLRGTVLRNTEWVIGMVLFTGEDTKIVMNSGGTPSKRSKVERQMNPMVFLNLLLLCVMSVACAVSDTVNEHRDYPRGALWLYGADQPNDNPSINGLITWAYALITFQNIVPISLYITVEAVRTCQALWIYFDEDMLYSRPGKRDTAALARSWNLSDDLGQIQYIFSDKTGTLTQNLMEFRKCSVGGRDPELEGTAANKPPQPKRFSTEDAAYSRALNGFFTVLSLCHTVLAAPDPETGELEYKAQSPDESALVHAAANVGWVFKGQSVPPPAPSSPDSGQASSPTSSDDEGLEQLRFTSSRKRMSVLVRRLDGDDRRIFLLSKGADNVIFERLKEGKDEELKKVTDQQLGEFASEGLRTLTLAYKVVTEEEYEAWNERYHEATVSLEDREAKIAAVSEEIELDLRLLGATAIEDKLQDGVPDTIADLKRAGIKVWVLTGDKLETAIAIGHSTNLIGKDSNIVVVRGGGTGHRSVYEQMVAAAEEFFPEANLLDKLPKPNGENLEASPQPGNLRRVNTGISSIVGENNGERPGGFILVIDGAGLSSMMTKRALMLRLALQCQGVICCRVSPLQKALVTKLVKDTLKVMTLAIGDGANDVSMIQAADIGVGISGEEGMQAVNASDYAIGQFRFLKKLLLVHGHWSYARNGTMIVNFFYKNIVCIGVLWWFQIYCAWSSAYAFEYTYLLWWNAFFTIFPVMAIGLFDRIADAKTLMAIPELYKYGREGSWFRMSTFLIYILDAVAQSVVIFFIVFNTYASTTTRGDGISPYQFEFSTTMAVGAVMATNLFTGLNCNTWTGWTYFAIFEGIVLVWVYTALYSIISPGWFHVPVYGNDTFLFTSSIFWLSLPLIICLSLLPRYASKSYKFGWNPNDLDRMRYVAKKEPHRDLIVEAQPGNALAALKRQGSAVSRDSRGSGGPHRASVDHRNTSRTDMATGLRSVHRGFGFSQEESGVELNRMQSRLSERRRSNISLSQGERSRTGKKGQSRLGKLSIRLRRKPDGLNDT